MIEAVGNCAKVRKGPPESLRQVWQWQLHIELGSVVMVYVTARQKHEPVRRISGGEERSVEEVIWKSWALVLCRRWSSEIVLKM